MQRKEEKPKKKLKYDPAEGLLPEIRRICGFPKHIDEISPRSAAKKKKIVEEEWSMPEAQNCGMCSSGGDILCCETCPASFHLSCLGIDESDVPEGNFYCNRCQKFPKDKPRLFPPEKCCPSTSPLIRVGNENKRNDETIGWHYEKLREEAGVSGQPRSYPDGVLPEGEEERMFSRCFPDPQLLQALAMANPMHFVLPPEYLKDRHFKPGDALDDKRPQICGERCTKCQLRDEWSPQLRCDFCHQIWHQKCVEPPLINIPRHNYWQCPNHTESLMEMIWQGEEIKREDKTSICRKYQKMERYMDGEQIFMTFARKCANLRVIESISSGGLSLKSEVFKPEDCEIDVKMALSPRKVRKGGRGKKKCDSRFLLNTFQFTFSPEKTEKTDKIERRKSPEKDRELEKLDRKRSIKFTDEELIMSIMPFDERPREEYVSEKMAGLDVEMAAGFYQRHHAMLERCRSFQTNFTEKEVLKQMRKDLDPVSTIRSSGTQSIADYQERNVRKKIKTEVEVLIRHIGLGNCDRQFSSPHTESFFRRQAPPTLPTEHLNSGNLLEICMNSQKEALELSRVFHYHKEPKDLSKLVLLGYDQTFGSREARDNYFPSSMSIWSKEPILAVLEKYQEEYGMEIKKKEEKVEDSDEEEEDEEKNSEQVLAQEDDDEMMEEAPRSEEPKVEMLDEEEVVEMLEEVNAPPQADFANESGPMEVENPVEEEIEKITQKLAKVKVRIFEKAESVYNAEGYFGEPDYYEYFDEPRKWKSLDDLEEWIDWGATQKTLQNYILMHTDESFNPDHNYASWNVPEEEPPLFRLHEPLILPPPKPVVSVEKPKKEAKKYEEINIPQPILDAIKREHSLPTDGRKRAAKAVKEIRRVDEPPIQKKRGRPLGSKNRKEGEERTPRKRQSTGTPRGRGGRGRGSRGGRGRGVSSRRQSDISTTNSGFFPSSEDVSRDGDFFMSPDAPSTSDTPPTASLASPPPTTGRLREIVEETRQKYAKLMIARSLEQEKENFFSLRDSALETWTSSDWRLLKERCQLGRLQSLIPYETRYFLPTQRVCAKLEIPGHLPIAIQRGLTKFGTARDCHVRLDRLTEHFCSFLADYHFDIIREYHSDVFYLSTLATESLFVNGEMVQRPNLTPFEAAEKMRMEGPSSNSNKLKCRCEQESEQDSAHQINSGKCVTTGILRLRNGSRIRVGCAELQFFIT